MVSKLDATQFNVNLTECKASTTQFFEILIRHHCPDSGQVTGGSPSLALMPALALLINYCCVEILCNRSVGLPLPVTHMHGLQFNPLNTVAISTSHNISLPASSVNQFLFQATDISVLCLLKICRDIFSCILGITV